MISQMASFIKREKIVPESPWQSYRKILYKFLVYLRKNKKEEDFKYLTYGYVPAKNMDCSIVDWLLKLEQSRNISMDELEMLYDFLIMSVDDPDSSHILSVITEFKRRQNILQMISNSGDDSIFQPQVDKYIRKFKISKELNDLLERWKSEMDDAAPSVSRFVIKKLYSEATQRIATQVALENKHGEALVIAEFLTSVEINKVKEMAFNMTTDDEYKLKDKFEQEQHRIQMF